MHFANHKCATLYVVKSRCHQGKNTHWNHLHQIICKTKSPGLLVVHNSYRAFHSHFLDLTSTMLHQLSGYCGQLFSVTGCLGNCFGKWSLLTEEGSRSESFSRPCLVTPVLCVLLKVPASAIHVSLHSVLLCH